MISTILISVTIGIFVTILILLVALPTKVQYIETINVQAPVSKVYDAVRFQEQLMAWSAWPTETKSQCEVKNTDGQVGAQTIYLSKGKQFGYQEITALVDNEKVSFMLKSKAPFEQETKLHFLLKSLESNKTEVTLWFDNTLKKPSLLLPYIFGIIKWTHNMHLKDLAGLKKFVETK
jgi:uncharacterized protein YndB with AHSA1/START domain